MLKKISTGLLSVFMILPCFLFAQTSYAVHKGNIIIEGSAGFSRTSSDDYRYSSISLSSSLMYFIISNLAMGGQFSISYYSDDSSTTIGAGPAVAYFFGSEKSKYYPFIEVQVGYAKNSITATAAKYLSFSSGIAIMISRNIAIRAAAALDYGEYQTKSLSMSLGLGFEAFIY